MGMAGEDNMLLRASLCREELSNGRMVYKENDVGSGRNAKPSVTEKMQRKSHIEVRRDEHSECRQPLIGFSGR